MKKRSSQPWRISFSACVIEDIDIKKLPAFDLEFLFLQIRCRSVSQIAEFRMTFKDCPNEPKCLREVSIDLSKVEVVAPNGHSRKIPLTDSIGVMMRYPTMELMEKIAKVGAGSSNIESLYEIIGGCIESVWQGKKVIPADTVPPAEVRDFVESLSREQFTKLMTFFESMPVVKTTVTQLCSTCGKEVSAEVKGLQNFFS